MAAGRRVPPKLAKSYIKTGDPKPFGTWCATNYSTAYAKGSADGETIARSHPKD
jgi:hypothetical protein